MKTTPLGSRESQVTRGRIVASLVSEPKLSRRDLVDRLGLGPATVSTQVRRMLEMGILAEGPAQVLGAGRPRIPLRVIGDAARAIGVGLGPMISTIAVVELDGTIIEGRQLKLDASDPLGLARELSLETTKTLETMPKAPWWGIGLALSGVISPARGVVKFSVVHDWRNVPLGEMLSSRHDGLPILLSNDISALAQRELFRPGVGTPADFLLVSVGVGVGMALVRDHRVITGDRGASTEMGHVSVDPSGPLCRCGNTGCLQALVGFEALAQAVESVGLTPALSASALAQQASEYPRAAEAIDHAGYWLGRAVGGACTMLGLTQVILTGESLPLWPHLKGGFELGLSETVVTLTDIPVVDRRPWDPEATAVGAASIVLNRVLGS